jgi:uncharacterized protein GlcG (DUF336 family)
MRTIRPWLVTLSLLAPSLVFGQAGTSAIKDEAGLFGKEAVRKALAQLAQAEQASHISVVIETVESLKGEPIEDVAIQRARQLGGGGVYLLMSKEEHKLSQFKYRRQFADRLPVAKQSEIRMAFTEEFQKGAFDAGLQRGVKLLSDTLIATAPTEPTAPHTIASPTIDTHGDSPLVVRNQVHLTLAGARKALAAAEAKATERGWKMNIAIVDEGGHLLTFARMDGARPASVATATTKAITAATFRQATGPLTATTPTAEVLLNVSLQNAAAASGGKITTLLGGVPILVDGQVIGAIGVGGGSGEQDAEVAKAGVEALLKDVGTPRP